jgi:hypothetical protein
MLWCQIVLDYGMICQILHHHKYMFMERKATMAPFGCADKPAEKYCWLIYCERKILFQLKKTSWKRRIISRMNRASEERRDYVVGMRHLPVELAAGSHGPIFHNRPQPNIMQYRSSSPPVCVWIQTETATEKIKTEEKMWHRDQSTRWDQSAKLF